METASAVPLPTQPARNAALYAAAKAHIRQEYAGIWSETEVERHFRDYVELGLSEGQLDEVRRVTNLRPLQRLLDMGCGFGSFVFVCRRAGIDAIGIDQAEFQLDFARRRFAAEPGEADPQSVYLHRDAQRTCLESDSYDVVTVWNLLEHVPDYKRVLAEAYRLLKPGGFFLGIAPNYLAFRREAHYLVPWIPLLPRSLAQRYLRLLGKRTDFFEHDIHYVTNPGVLQSLRNVGFRLLYPQLTKLRQPELLTSNFNRRVVETVRRWRLTPLVVAYVLAAHWNPFRSSISFAASKPT